MSHTYRAVRVHEADGPLVLERTSVGQVDSGWVRVRVHASGMCGADIGTARAHGADGAITPGHEIAGVIAQLGTDARGWAVGDRVAVGWFGGSCGHCPACREGDVVHCPDRQIPGISYPGGWAEEISVPVDALARIPDELTFEEAAPMGCAGVTTFNAIRDAHLRAGSRVAVFGIGGLGHLAVQFAARMGHEVVAVARGTSREQAARDLGARQYLDSEAGDPGTALAALGGADLILSTATSTSPVAGLLRGLRRHGRLTMIGVDGGSVEVPAAQMVMNGSTLTGHLTGSPVDIETAMRFAAVTGLRPVVERVPLADAAGALERLKDGQARFRIVLNAEEV